MECCAIMEYAKSENRHKRFKIGYVDDEYFKDKFVFIDQKKVALHDKLLPRGWYLMTEGAFGGWFAEEPIHFCPFCGAKI